MSKTKHNNRTHPFRCGRPPPLSLTVLSLVTVTHCTSTITNLPGAVSLSVCSNRLSTTIFTSPEHKLSLIKIQNGVFCFMDVLFFFFLESVVVVVVLIFMLLFTVDFFKSITTSLASSSSRRKILRCLFNSQRRKKEWKEHILLGLLHQYLPSLSVSAQLSPSPAGSFKIYLPKIRFCSYMLFMCFTRFWHSLLCVFQIRRYVYNDVLRLDDAQKLFDCAFVQVSIILMRLWWNSWNTRVKHMDTQPSCYSSLLVLSVHTFIAVYIDSFLSSQTEYLATFFMPPFFWKANCTHYFVPNQFQFCVFAVLYYKQCKGDIFKSQATNKDSEYQRQQL